MDNSQELRRRVAYLESRLDQVEAEFSYLNNLLVECGFTEGLASLKLTIEDLLEESNSLESTQNETDKPGAFH